MEEKYKSVLNNILMTPLVFTWYCWLASSLGVPFLTAIYITELDKLQGLTTIGSDTIMWSTILGPFSIPISLVYAGMRTIQFFNK